MVDRRRSRRHGGHKGYTEVNPAAEGRRRQKVVSAAHGYQLAGGSWRRKRMVRVEPCRRRATRTPKTTPDAWMDGRFFFSAFSALSASSLVTGLSSGMHSLTSCTVNVKGDSEPVHWINRFNPADRRVVWTQPLIHVDQ